MSLKDFYEEKTLNSWESISKIHSQIIKDEETWVFRGQCDKRWRLETTLERAIISFSDSNLKLPPYDSPDYEDKRREILSKGIGKLDVKSLEHGLLRHFKRQAPIYLGANVPKEKDYMVWFALMQHYGAPTRLLDFTYSFYVALFFAVESAKGDCAIWALKTPYKKKEKWLNLALKKALNSSKAYNQMMKDRNCKKDNTFKNVFMSKKDLVYPMNPYILHERLSVQQGLFLCTGNVTKPFEDNLMALLSKLKNPKPKEVFVKYLIPDDKRKEIIKHLHRMNMNSTTLFPGLQGYSSSLKSLLVFPWMLRSDEE